MPDTQPPKHDHNCTSALPGAECNCGADTQAEAVEVLEEANRRRKLYDSSVGSQALGDRIDALLAKMKGKDHA